MNVEKAIEDLGKVLDSLDDVAKNLLNAADPEGTKKDLGYYQNALAECKRMSSLKGTSPTSFVAAISKSLREKPAFLALLDVNYESDVSFMISDFMKKPKEDIAVMLPDGFYRPFLRYKILEQINRLPDKFPWDIKMVSASNIEEWIAFNSARRLQSLAEKIVLITYAFPDRDTITTYIKEAIDAISEDDFEREAFNARVVNDGEYIGSTISGPHLCRMPPTIKSIKDKLVGKTLERIAECIANIIAKKISEFMLEKLKRTLKINIEELRDLVSTKTFQNILVVHIEKIVVTSFLVVSAGIVGITLVEAGVLTAVGLATGAAVFAVATAATAVAFTLLFPVDVNSETWRRKVANETFLVFKDEREKVKQMVCEKAIGEINKKFRESEKALMKSYTKICDVWKNLEMANRVHTVETFSNEDFDRMNAIVGSARHFREKTSCLESIGCVAERDQFECVLQGKRRQQECGSEVVVILHEDEKIDAAVTDVPLVYIDVQRNQEEFQKIQRFKKKKKIKCMDDLTYQNIRGKLDSENLLSLANSHLNLVAIDICTTKSSKEGDIIEESTCIVIYCFAKGFIPIGENFFPKEIMGIQTDVREAYALALGTRDYNNLIGPGCSIGRENHGSTGSIGFFLRHKHDGHFAFVSSAHVFFDLKTLRNLAEGKLHTPLHEYRVVQPSDTDSRATTILQNRICGYVKSIHFNKKDEKKCKDFIVVASEASEEGRHPGNILRYPSISTSNREESGCYNWPNGYEIHDFGEAEGSMNKTVFKVGRSTELTRGKYDGPLPMLNVSDGNGGKFILFDLLKIKACRVPRFSDRGDSGAGIFLKSRNTLKPFAIVEASMGPINLTAAIPITEFKSVCKDYDLQSFDREETYLQDDDFDDDDDDDDDGDDDSDKEVGSGDYDTECKDL